eukprot:Gb_00613 [translate_table: standard]
MGLKEKIGKEVEAHERLSSELQQSNDVVAYTRWKHGKSLEDLQGREAEINRLIQEKEVISIELSRMESNNNELKERLAGQDNTMQELTKQIVENLEARLFDLEGRVLSALPIDIVGEMQTAFMENLLHYTFGLEEKEHILIAQTKLLVMNSKDQLSKNTSLKIDLKCKEEVLKGLQFDLSLLQESASKAKDRKDEVQEDIISLKLL